LNDVILKHDKTYTKLIGISYLISNESYCKNNHSCIIPACTETIEESKLYCDTCGTLIWRVAKIKVIEKEI
jgi:hypothetical protein